MKKLLLLSLTIILSLPVCAQNPAQSFDDIKKPIMNYDSYEALKTLRADKQKYIAPPTGINYYNQALATVYTMLCYSPDSVIFAEYIGTTGREPKQGIKNVDTIDLSTYKITPAKEHIINRAKNETVLMINESHTRPSHRLLLKSILGDLYKQGYRTLCLEALNYQPEPYKDLKTIFDKGYYTKEPCFAEMVRHALLLGYTIYGYEATSTDYKISNNRDSLQAVHLRDIETQNTGQKMIVWAGHGHTSKSSKKSMYTYFSALTGKTPLSVNQTTYIERPTQMHENPLYIAIFNNCSSRDEVVLDGLTNNSADIYVFAPRNKYINGRPDYLLENGERITKTISVRRPSLIKAYYNSEYIKHSNKCVPVDIVVAEKAGKYSLLLPKEGKFKIIIQNL